MGLAGGRVAQTVGQARQRESVQQGREEPRGRRPSWRGLLALPLSVWWSLPQGSPSGLCVWLKPLIYRPGIVDSCCDM